MYRYWKLLGNLHKPKLLTAIDRFVPVDRLKSSSLTIHELIAANRHDLDSFPSPLDLKQSSTSLRMIKGVGSGLILAAALAILLSYCSAQHLYTDCRDINYYDHWQLRFNDIHDHVIGYNWQ